MSAICWSNSSARAATDGTGAPELTPAPIRPAPPGIFIDQAAQVGGRCIFVGAVGDDAFGEVVLRRLVDHGVDARQLIRIVTGVPTGTAFVSYNDDGSRDFVYNIVLSAAARFDADDATIAALDAFGLDVMHVSGSALGDAGHVRESAARLQGPARERA